MTQFVHPLSSRLFLLSAALASFGAARYFIESVFVIVSRLMRYLSTAKNRRTSWKQVGRYRYPCGHFFAKKNKCFN